MNYRHAFHAGNFADVFKHLLLTRILLYLARKASPFRVIDTHAGTGRYDLAGPEASRTGEWRDGIGRLEPTQVPAAVRDLVAPYLATVGRRDADGRPLRYPGSPAVAQALLRPHDRLLLAERHPDDAAALARTMRGDRRVKVETADGYAVLNAVLPPPERRGLVLIDPPFEDRAEFDAIGAALRGATRKWATGVYAVWYPIKDAALVAAFARLIATLPLTDCLWLEFARDRAETAEALRGCGLLVINPPFVLADECRQLLPVLADLLSAPDRARFRTSIRLTSQGSAPGD